MYNNSIVFNVNYSSDKFIADYHLKWFTELINELGQNMDDTFFPEFLRFIRKHMLQPDRNRRADCIQVEAFLERLKRKPVENPYWRFNGTVVYRNGNDEDMAENGTM